VAGERGIGSYVGAPIRNPDGRALGMLCCVSRDDGAQLDAESARFVEFLAELVGQRLTPDAGPDDARARVDAVLAEDAVQIAFQPIVEVATGRVTAYEALSRFEHADTACMFADAALSGRGVELELLSLRAALAALLLPHLLRTIGAAFLVPGVVGEELPRTFAAPAAYGDLLAVLLALLALAALRVGSPVAPGLVWLFNVEGTVDLLNALLQGTRLDLGRQYHLGPTWFIPTYLVPGWLVLHVLVFALLVARAGEYHVRRAEPGIGSPI
jgi:hypothetical protein